MKHSAKTAFCGMAVALQLVILYIATMLKLNTIALMVVVSCIEILAVLRCGKTYAGAAFVATAILAWLLVPDKSLAVMYTVFFGWYGIVKSFAERGKSRILEWVIKIVVVNAAFFIGWYVLTAVLNLPAGKLHLWVIWTLGQIAFVAYDLFLSFAIGFYHRKVWKGNM